MRLLIICLLMLILFGCCPIKTTTYEAAQATHDAVVPEWEEFFREKFKDDEEKIERREKLLREWDEWLKALKDASDAW